MGLLEDLINSYGISGAEEPVRDIIQTAIKPYVDEVFVDKFGNLIAHKKGKIPRVMLAAHMDEIGLVAKNIDESGKIYFSIIGGIEIASLIGQRVSIPTKKYQITGVITSDKMSIGELIPNMPKLDELYIDTGLNKAELQKLGVETGSYIQFFECGFTLLGLDDLISGKSLDDRIGCYVLVELAKRTKLIKNEVFYVFTVQEEIGLYGARTSAYTIDPSWALAIDVTPTDDAHDNPIKVLGNGPCITIKDGSMLGNRCINNWIKDLAAKNKIPLQYDVSDFGMTDALTMSLSKGGIPSTVVAVPIRNIHTVIGIANKKDIEHTITLLEILLKNPPLVCLV